MGFHVGLNLADFWRLEAHKLGEWSLTHFADGTANKKRMQGKSCFNFTTVDEVLFAELSQLTAAGFKRFKE